MDTNKTKEPQEIIALVKDSGNNKVKLAITDIDGILRGKLMHLDKFLSLQKKALGSAM